MENRTGIDYGPYIEGEPEVEGLTPLEDLTPAELTQRQKEITQVLQETSIQVPGYAEPITFSQEDIDTIITFERILWYRPETLREIIPPRFIANVANLGVSPKEWMKAALKRPQLFYQSPETVNKNITETATLLGLKKEDYIKAALRAPSLFYQSPETINRNITETATLLGLEKEDYIKAALKDPSLLCRSPETTNGNITDTADLLGIEDKRDYIKAALKQPSLFYQSPETTNRNITDTADLLGIEDKKDYIKAALRAPSLFAILPETVNTNIEEAAVRLGFAKAQYLDIALRQPPLFYRSPVTVSENFKVVKILAGNSDNIAREMVADLPRLLTYAEERNLLHYIARQITGGETNLINNPQEIIIEYTKQHPPKASSHSLLDPDKHPEMVALLAWLRHNPRVQTKKLEELLSAFIEAGKKRRRKRTKRLKEDYETEKTAREEVEKPAREEADNF